MTGHTKFLYSPVLLGLLLAIVGSTPRAIAQTQTYTITTLHNFGDGTVANDGALPAAALIAGNDGSFYGTTEQGGSANKGTIFKMTPSGVITVLHSFGDGTVANDGSFPTATLLLGADGNFYGTTSGGGIGAGTIFRMTPAGTVTLLHQFNDGTVANDGTSPGSSLIQDSSATLYGTTQGGGANGKGTVFSLTSGGTYTLLHSFNGTDGDGPVAALVDGKDGFFYGVTTHGGANGNGTAFKITPSGAITVLHSFAGGNEGAFPNAPLLLGTDGNLYGATSGSGGNSGVYGTVFMMTKAGVLTTQHIFSGSPLSFQAGTTTDADGGEPLGALVEDSSGNFYGTTARGGLFPGAYNGIGPRGNGSVFKLPSTGSFSLISSFIQPDSNNIGPAAGLLLTSNGDLYGTTESGGSAGKGSIFRVSPGPPGPAAALLVNPVAPVIPWFNSAGDLFDVNVSAFDQSGNPTPAYSGTVHFTSSDPLAVLPGNSTLTNGTGSFPVRLYSGTTNGADTVSATDTVTPSISGTSPFVMVQPTVFVLATPASVTAGVPFQFTVTAEDPSYNNATQTPYAGTIHFTTNAPGATLPADGKLTNGTGTFTATFTTVGTTAANYTITATDTIASAVTGMSGAIPVNPGPSNGLTITAPASVSVGIPFNVTVRAYDQFGNLATTYAGTIHFTSSDGIAALPADAGLSNGSGTFAVTLKTAGTHTITATDTANSHVTGTSGPITVIPNTATHLSITTATTVTVGAPMNVTVTALDANNNVAAGYTGTVHFTSTDNGASLPADTALTNGAASVVATLNTLGNQTITASDIVNGTITGTSSPIDVTLAATHFAVSAPAAVQIGKAFNVTVTALDQNNNIATGWNRPLRFTSTDQSASLPSGVSLTNGVGAFSITLNSGSSQTVTVTDTSVSSITGTSSPILVVLASYSAGLQMITVPLPGGSAASLFSDAAIKLYGYDGSGYTTPSTITPGAGYWVNLKASTDLLSSANLNPRPTSIALHQGWNIVGDPFTTAEPASSVTVQAGSGSAVPFVGTQSAVAQVAYTWQVGDTVYETSIGSGITFQPFKGYWLYTYDPCTLIFN